MKTFFRSLYGRLTLAYLGLLLIFCAASVFFTVRTASRFFEESAQELNRNLATYLSHEIEPYLGDSLALKKIEDEMGNLMHVNPWVEIYLLDNEGRIITYKADPGAIERPEIATAPIHQFLRAESTLPIVGDDPKDESERKIFSAAPVNLNGTEQGYLYVVLHGKEYETAAAMISDTYVLRGAALNLALLFLFAALAGVGLFAVLTRRFRKMTSTVEEIAAGNLDRRVEVASDDEVGTLGRSINTMAARLQANLAVLQRRDDLRREFIANITHDLRSPLTSIQGYVETALMKNDSLTSTERMEYLQIIQEETSGLNELVNQLLELAKLDADQIEPRRESFFACELVQDVLMKFQPQASAKDVRLGTDLAYDVPMVSADLQMVERALVNLIDNAVRHTPAGGHVRVEGQQVDGHVRLSVIDTGVGIPPEELDRVTERFYKGRRGEHPTGGGTGLGLAIVKRIVDLHGSELRIDSAPGAGTRVTFDLAAEETAAVQDEVVRV